MRTCLIAIFVLCWYLSRQGLDMSRRQFAQGEELVTAHASPKPCILVCNGAFYPGNEATGATQSLVALIELLSGEYQFQY